LIIASRSCGPSGNIHATIGKPTGTGRRQTLGGLLQLSGDRNLHGFVGVLVSQERQARQPKQEDQDRRHEKLFSQRHG
jgi:hypothetical protein